jgi:hypothetical protein
LAKASILDGWMITIGNWKRMNGLGAKYGYRMKEWIDSEMVEMGDKDITNGNRIWMERKEKFLVSRKIICWSNFGGEYRANMWGRKTDKREVKNDKRRRMTATTAIHFKRNRKKWTKARICFPLPPSRLNMGLSLPAKPPQPFLRIEKLLCADKEPKKERAEDGASKKKEGTYKFKGIELDQI